MAIPRLITITGTALGVDGTPVPGVRAVFTPNLATPDGESATDDFMVPEVITAVSSAAGEISVAVPSTDDPNFTTTGWTWNLVIAYPGSAVALNYNVAIPYASPGQTLKLWALLPIPGDAGAVLYATVASLAAYLPKALGVVTDSTLSIVKGDNSAGIRFRSTGGAVDFDKMNGDIVVGSFAGPGFTGTQTGLQRWKAAGSTFAGLTEFGDTVYNGQQNIDGATGVASLGAKNGLANVRFCGYKATAGAPTTGAWVARDAVIDSAGVWHLCTAPGTPGTWT